MPTVHLTADEAAERLRENVQTVRARLRAGDLKGAQTGEGGRWRVSEAAVENYLRRITR